ncbi:hypothetical protein GCM10025768_24930 [Microbacterium pseudoresistens]|uniref:DUF2017 domain-containing protein n=1 Tax=Microbacterium pseudoresistens TaxID=640634 RepID=A0A7Y9JP70_9MICO|nr:hypothetical protein [Microbacterium pseudoresistens]
MNDRIVLVPLARLEGRHLAGLVDEFVALLTDTASDANDPGLDRLTPEAYPDDAEASAEFSRATADDLLDRRAADARTVRAALQRFVDGEGEGEDLDPLDVVIDERELDAWLRTLTALRLVIATRLSVADGVDPHDHEDPRFGVYDWLGYRLDGLIEAADARDL